MLAASLFLHPAVQDGSVSSVTLSVFDASTGSPIEAACVRIGSADSCRYTDSAGRVRLAARRPVQLSVEAPGFDEALLTVDASGTVPERVGLRPSTLRIDERVVVAGRIDEARSGTPRSTSVVTRADIEARGMTTTPDALMDTAGVLVQKTNLGAGSPYIRGLMGNQVLVMIDGIRLNNATYRYGPNQYLGTIDPGAIDRMEVVRGPGSVLYGSDAIGGVISVSTRRPALTQSGSRVGVTTRLLAAAGSPEQSLRSDVEWSGPQLGIRVGVGGHRIEDVRTGSPTERLSPSGYREGATDAAIEWHPSGRHRVSATVQAHAQGDVPRWDQVVQRGFAAYTFDPQARQLGIIRYTVRGTRMLDTFSVALATQHAREERTIRRQGASLETFESDRVHTTGLVADASRQLGAGIVLQGGAEFYHDAVRSARTERNVLTGLATSRRGLYPDGASARSLSAFTRTAWSTPRAQAEAGIRFTDVAVRASDATFRNLDLSPQALVAQGAAAWRLTPGWQIIGSVAQSFRAPNIDDVSTLGRFDSGIEVPSPGLAPERGLTSEVGFRVTRPTFTGSAVAYRTDLQDLIDRVRTTYEGATTLDGQPVFRKANVSRARVTGWETELAWRVTGTVSVAAHLTATHGEALTRNEPMRRIPPTHGGLRVEWRPIARATVGTALRAAGAQRRLSSGDLADHRISRTGTNGWSTVDLFARIQVSAHAGVSAGVRNLLDERYRIHGSGLDAPGRSAWLSLHLTP